MYSLFFPIIFSPISVADFNEIIEMIKGLKQKFDQSNLLLTLEIGVPHNFIPKNYNLISLSYSVDFLIFVQTYDYVAGKLNDYTISKGLQDRNITQIQKKIGEFIDSGVLPSKLVIYLNPQGLLFFISEFYEKFRRFISYHEICQEPQRNVSQNWNKTYDKTGSDILHQFNGNYSNNLFIIYESLRTVANEGRFAVQNGLAGFLTGPIHFDDYSGICGIDADTFEDFKSNDSIKLIIPIGKSTTFPLIRTINAAIVVTSKFNEKIESETPLPTTTSAVKPNIFKNLTQINDPHINGAAINVIINSLCLLAVAMLISLAY